MEKSPEYIMIGGDDGVDGAEIDIIESGYDHRYHKSWDSNVKLKDRDVRELFEG